MPAMSGSSARAVRSSLPLDSLRSTRLAAFSRARSWRAISFCRLANVARPLLAIGCSLRDHPADPERGILSCPSGQASDDSDQLGRLHGLRDVHLIAGGDGLPAIICVRVGREGGGGNGARGGPPAQLAGGGGAAPARPPAVAQQPARG